MQHKSADRTVVGILLAAGRSQRFGADKLLHPLANGEPVAVAAARTLIATLPRSLAVVRPGHDELASALHTIGLDVIVNTGAQRGIGSSIAAGIQASAAARGWVIALADMPWIELATIRQVHQALATGASMVAPLHAGRRGHPVGFSSIWQAQLSNLDGDSGAREMLAENSSSLTLIETDDAGVVRDIDHPRDLDMS